MQIEKLLHQTEFVKASYDTIYFTKHFHDTYTIGIAHHGKLHFTSDNKSYDSYKHSSRIINPADVHDGTTEQWSYTNFYPSVELLEEVYEQIHGKKATPFFTSAIYNDEQLYQYLYTFFASIFHKKSFLEIESHLVQALSYLINTYAHIPNANFSLYGSNQDILRAIDYIHNHLQDDVSLETLAQVSNLSKYYFLRTFKKHMGMTPHAYILQQKIQQAKKEILLGHPISQAAFDAGFADQSHFNRNFKKLYGYTPKRLRSQEDIFIFGSTK